MGFLWISWISFLWMSLSKHTFGNPDGKYLINPSSYLGMKVIVLDDSLDIRSSKSTTLREIYGESFNPSDFNPGKEFLDYLYYAAPMTTPRIHLSKTRFIENTQRIHKFDHINRANEVASQHRPVPLTLIVGAPKSGKTTTLRSMYKQSIDKQSSILNVFIHLPLIDQSIWRTGDSLTFAQILEASVPKPIVGLLINVMEVATPGRIKLFLDGIDEVPLDRQDKILHMITRTLLKANAPIVLTTSNANLLQRFRSPFLIIEIPEIKIPDRLSSTEVGNYLTEYWMDQYQAREINLQESRVRKYVRAFKMIIEGLPLPRTVGMLRHMADFFMNTVPQDSLLSITQYAQENSLLNNNPRALRDMIKYSDEYNFPKMDFYDAYFSDLSQHELSVYENTALFLLNRVIDENPPPRDLQQFLGYINSVRRQHGHYRYPYLRYDEKNLPINFIDQDVKNYFAAKCILKRMASGAQLIEIWRALITNREYNYILEFINTAIIKDANKLSAVTEIMKTVWEREVLSKRLQSTQYKFFPALDNFIQFKMNGLCATLFTGMNYRSVLSYLKRPTQLQSKNKFALGIMVSEHAPSLESLQSSDYIPRKTMFMVSGTRTEMLVKMHLQSGLQATENAGFKWTGSHLLEVSAGRSIESLRRLISSFGPGPYPPEVLNSAMFAAVNNLGPQSVPVLAELRKLGGVPHEVSVDGRTLAHVAVQWHDPDLLKTIHEEFHVPLLDKPDNFGRTILFTALDSNPFLSYTYEGFWGMIKYLVDKADLSINIEIMKSNMPEPVSTANIFRNYFLLTTTSTCTDECKSALETLDLVDLNNWDIPLNLKAARRHTIERKCKYELSNDYYPEFVTLTELILSHHGIDALSPESKQAYEDTAIELLKKESSRSNNNQIKRMFKVIIRNINSHDEFVRIWTRVHELMTNLKPNRIELIKPLFHEWGVNRNIDLPPGLETVEQEIVPYLPNPSEASSSRRHPTLTNALRDSGDVQYGHCRF